jgi:basic amino acid/polyamine antiporter, APA family
VPPIDHGLGRAVRQAAGAGGAGVALSGALPDDAHGSPRAGALTLASGVGLVVSTTVGAGIFVTTGFMAQSMGPAPILLCWVAGAVIALAGTRAYAAIAALIPRSGGEYRYVHDLLHPALGYVAGWSSLLLGFAAPMAIVALAASTYAHALWPALPAPRAVAAALILAFAAAHAAGLRTSHWTQDLLAALKVLLLLAFVAMGLALGRNECGPGGPRPIPRRAFPRAPS